MSFNEGLFERADCTCEGSFQSTRRSLIRVDTGEVSFR